MSRRSFVGSHRPRTQHKAIERAVSQVAKAQRRRIFTEVLEKRILLSSYDLSTAGAAHSVESGLNQFGGKIESFLNSQEGDSASLINTTIPLVLTAQNGALVAPRLQDVIATPVDLDGNGSISGTQETSLHGLDTSPSGGDGVVGLTEALQNVILSPIDSYLSSHTSGTNADFVSELTNLGTSLGLSPNLAVTNISVADQSTASLAKFDYKFTLSFENQLPIDLGVLGDQLGLAFPDTAKLPVDGTASFDMVFGTRPNLPGPGAADSDFFFYLKSPIDLTASIHVGDADPSAAPALATAMNVGFLGTHIANGVVTLNATLNVSEVNPGNAGVLGFTADSYSGSVINANTLPLDTLPYAGKFDLTVGAHGQTMHVSVPSGTAAANEATATASALSAVGIGSVATQLNSGQLRLTLQSTSDPSLGFAAGAFDSSGTLTAASAYSSPGSAVTEKFPLTLNGTSSQIISVSLASGADIDAAVTALQSALNAAGFSATVKAQKSGTSLQLVSTGGASGQSLEIPNTMSLTGTSFNTLGGAYDTHLGATINGAASSYSFNLPVTVDSGLKDQTNADFAPAGLFIKNAATDPFATSLLPDNFSQVRRLAVPLNDNLDSIEFFRNLTPAGVIGVTDQFATWLSSLRNSDFLAKYPIPFAKAAYDKVLDLETMLRNSLLFDKTLTGSSANKLEKPDPTAPDPSNPDMIPVFSDAQTLGTTLTSISSGAIHPTWNTSTHELTFDVNVSHSLPAVQAPIDVSLNFQPLGSISSNTTLKLSASAGLGFTMGFNLEDAAPISLSTLLTDTTLNGGKGVAHQSQQAVTAAQDADIIYGRLTGDAVFDLKINGGSSVTVTVPEASTATNLTISDLLADFDAVLPAHITAQSIGTKIMLVGDSTVSSLSITADPGNVAVTQLGLTTGDAIASPYFAGSAAAVSTGRLAGTASFDIQIGSSVQTITIRKSETLDFTNLDQLIALINQKISQTPDISGNVIAGSDGTHLILTGIGTTPASFSVHDANSEAQTSLGLGSGTVSSSSVQTIQGASTVPLFYGLTGDAHFTIAGHSLTLSAGVTTDNHSILDLVADINALLAASGISNITAGHMGGKLIFTSNDGSTFSVSAGTGDPAADQLGLPTSQSSNLNDLLITTPDGNTFTVSLAGATDLASVASKINLATGGKVTVALNGTSTGLQLTSTVSGDTLFSVDSLNGSPAAYQLGILKIANPLHRPSVSDDIIVGDAIGTLALADRFFAGNAKATGDVTLVPERDYSDLAIDASNTSKITSKSSPFSNLDIGLTIHLDGGGGFNAGDFTITAVDAVTGAATLSAPAGTAGSSNGKGEVKGISATAALGFVGLKLAGDGNLTAHFEVDLGVHSDPSDPSSPFQPKVTLTQLYQDLQKDGIDAIAATPSATGSGSMDLNLTVTPAIDGITPPGGAHIKFTLSDLGNPFASPPVAPNISFDASSLGDFLNFKNVKFSDVLSAFTQITNVLSHMEGLPGLNTKIPVINESFADLLGFASRLGQAVQDFQSNPAGAFQQLVSKLRQVLNIPSSIPDSSFLKFTMDGTFVKFDLKFSDSFSKSLNVSMGLGNVGGIPATLSGSAGLNASGSANLELTLGINTSDPTDIELYDTTGVSGSLSASGNNLTFRGTIGPLGIYVTNGTANITLTAGLAGASFGRQPIGTVLANLGTDFTPSISGSVKATLPVFFPTESTYLGDIGLTAGPFTSIADLDPSNIHITLPPIDFSSLFSNFDPTKNFLLMVDGLDTFLKGLQDALNGEVLGFKMPIIGDKLAAGAQFIQDFRDTFITQLRQQIENSVSPDQNLINQALFHLLGPSGLNLLKDTNGDHTVTAADIKFTTNANTPGTPVSDLSFEWGIDLGQDHPVNANIGLDLGIPGLGIKTSGGINLDANWDLGFDFGINFTDGFFVNANKTHLDFGVSADLKNAALVGQLAFLELDIADNTSHPSKLAADFNIGLTGGDADGNISFANLGTLGVQAGISASADIDLNLTAKLNNSLIPSNVAAIFPSVKAEFLLDWALGSPGSPVSLTSVPDGIADGLKLIEFKNVGLDIGSFFSSVIGPILQKVQSVTEPIQPIIDILTARIPVISDLAGQTITLLDIAQVFGEVDAGLITSIKDVADLITEFNNFTIPKGDVILPFGNFVIFDSTPGSTDGLSGLSTSNITNPNFDLGKASSISTPTNPSFNLDDQISQLNTEGGDSAQAAQGLTTLTGDSAFSFPILKDPSQIFGLLMGRPATLITFTMAPLNVQFSYTQYFPIFGPLGAAITGQIGATINLSFGYDTTGIQEFASGGFRDPSLLFDGFYISDVDAKGNVVPQVVLTGGLSAAAELNLGIAQAGVSGGIFATVDFTLYDPNHDGKVRISELVSSVENEVKYGDPVLAPLAIFDISGKVFAQLSAFLKIDLFFFKLDKTFNITPEITLATFDVNFARPPVLASVINGDTLQLNIGPNASQRVNGDTTDGPEEIHAKRDGNKVDVWSDQFGIPESNPEVYDLPSHIIAVGGEGDDTIDIEGFDGSNVSVEVDGGDGNDTITVTGAKSVIHGGTGNDTISGTGGPDLIYGDQGNDSINGNGGADLIFGDGGTITTTGVSTLITPTDGDDTIDGGAGDDLIFGGGGADSITGGDGNDFIIGDGGQVNFAGTILTDGYATLNLATVGTYVLSGNISTHPDALTVLSSAVINTELGTGGNDVINGGAGNDIIFGGKGNDTIGGDDDNDLIFGQAGFDSIDGGNGNDTVFGGDDNDTINGNAGDDLLYGDNGGDFIHGNDGNDTIHGGAGPDTLFGDAGNDTMFGESDPDIMFGGTGNDFMTGDTGNDIMLGDDGLVATLGNNPASTADDKWVGNGDPSRLLGYTGDGSDLTTDLIITDIVPGDGNDTINGGSEDDIILGGGGNDVMFGDVDPSTISGSSSSTTPNGSDIIIGDGGAVLFAPGRQRAQIFTIDPSGSENGNDIAYGNNGNDIIFGGTGNDTLYGDQGPGISAVSPFNDIIFGDNGKVVYSGGKIATIVSTDPGFGGNDLVQGDDGSDIIIGGVGNDVLHGGLGTDIVIGDDGELDYNAPVDPNLDTLDDVKTIDPSFGGADSVFGDDGNDTLFGGASADSMFGGTGNDIMAGDNGEVDLVANQVTLITTTDVTNATGGNDSMFGNEGDDIMLGGVGNDTIEGNTGNDIMIGDNGLINYTGGDSDPTTIDLIQTSDPDLGGNDSIFGNAGNDTAMGGHGDDHIYGDLSDTGGTTDTGSDVLLGDGGQILKVNGNTTVLQTFQTNKGGNDTIEGNAGSDIILGGFGQDQLFGDGDSSLGHLSTADAGDIILGDNGALYYVYAGDVTLPADTNPATLDLITVTDPTLGDSDTIHGDAGNDSIMGGTAGDTIYGDTSDAVALGAGNDLIFGDAGKIYPQLPSNINFYSIFTGAADGGFGDTVFGNGGDDSIIGQQGDDLLYGGAGDDDIIGGQNVPSGPGVPAIDELDPASPFNDSIDGGSGNDLIAGDNARIIRHLPGDTLSVLDRVLSGSTLYDAFGNPLITGASQNNPNGTAGRDLILYDHSTTASPGTYGNDSIAGGAGDDSIFGELGNDVIQGDSAISNDVLALGHSVSAATDGNDYIEGNGGSDLIYGDLGQDDIIGGNSDLFGLNTPAKRPDGADVIFGGDGTKTTYNDVGDTSATGHARDADFIVGDNGDILRLVGMNGGPAGNFLSFNYDNYGAMKIIPRVETLLDYHLPGTADIGGDDTIHGEAGDDSIHGETGNDVLFGEGQDDDIFGEAGADRIYGGTGEDGIIGDDGLIQTSRNGLTEPLYGLLAPNAQVDITLPGPFTGAWIYITGRIEKTVTLAAANPEDGNDIIYGGLGDDFIHGAAGDDAISGAEAQLQWYNSTPVLNFFGASGVNPLNPLGYDPVTRKLLPWYDANHPMSKIPNFFLNFDAYSAPAGSSQAMQDATKIDDGKDRIFGDTGNDWLVGGTDNDRIFGGLGDDVINADDNQDNGTSPGLNNLPDDTTFADRDFVFGGGGLDAMVANTGGDRMFDWTGEFNSYWVPFSPFGEPTVYRTPNPHVFDFLKALGKESGADQSVAEPNGELGLVTQQDPQWNDQHGGPRDPQAGNTPGTHRDTQGGPEDDRGTALPLAAVFSPAASPLITAASVANSGNVTLATVVVTADPSIDGQVMLMIGGTNGADTIMVQKGATLGGIQVIINGVDKGQFFAPAGTTFSRIVVYGNDGNDNITINSNLGAIMACVYGQGGNDTLVGGAGTSMLDGGDGNDSIVGGNANDILVGGGGSDVITTGHTDNIIIGGIYSLTEDLDAAFALLGEWSLNLGFATRVSALRTGVGTNSVYALSTATVYDDGTLDKLLGAAAGSDWYFLGSGDTSNVKPTDVVN